MTEHVRSILEDIIRLKEAEILVLKDCLVQRDIEISRLQREIDLVRVHILKSRPQALYEPTQSLCLTTEELQALQERKEEDASKAND